MFIPTNNNDELIYCYDVNSLYPYIMNSMEMPTGTPIYFEGNIRKYEPNAFGFFYCKITTPTYLEHPILQRRVKTKDGIRTIAGLGTWEGWVFSKKMDYCITLGYKFEILRGYLFKPRVIFKEFTDYLYSYRLEFTKDNPLNYIAKLLMNSLYGRFGMNDKFTESKIIARKDYLKFEDEYNQFITDVFEIDNDYILVQTMHDDLNTLLDNGSETHNVNIAVSSAISSYSRIHVAQFKNNPQYKLYYSDTDSIYINKPLPEEFISSTELGKMKLEHICTKAVFLAPKVYSLITVDGEEITKVKGITNEGLNSINIEVLESLLYKDSKLEVLQDKWYKDLTSGTITIKDQLYTLKVTGNKRELIYQENKLVGTKPVRFD